MPSTLPDLSIVVPTYGEAANLPVLVQRIADALHDRDLRWEVIVVDDNSPDGTPDVCEELSLRYPVRLIVRRGERGLSSAVIAGMRAARGEVLLCMDADLSHPPEAIPVMVAALGADDGADFVIGSRYVSGGRTEDDWGLFRELNSRVATLLALPLTRISDPMAGLFALKRDAFIAADADLNPIGYKIGLELLVKSGCRRVVETPIHFRNRLHGESKLNLREQVNYLRHLGRLYAFRFPGLVQFVRFGLVGLSGMAVDLTVFATLLAAGVVLPLASAGAIAIAMTWNFCGNRVWTFSDRRRASWLRQYLEFCGSCLLGASLNWATRVLLWRYVPFFSEHELLAAAAGVAAGTASNFALCRAIVFRKPRSAGREACQGAQADATHAAPSPDASTLHSPDPGLSSSSQIEKQRTRMRLTRCARLLLVGLCAAAVGLPPVLRTPAEEPDRDQALSPIPAVAGAFEVTPAASEESPSVAGSVPAALVNAANAASQDDPAPATRRSSWSLDFSDAAVEKRLRDSATYLASDDLEGRGVRTRGLDLAAEYLAEEFTDCGLRTELYNGGPFHEFSLFSRATKGGVQELSFQRDDVPTDELQPGADFTSLTLSTNAPFSLPVAFAGYGITAPEHDYDDYESLDAAGKAVIVLRREPQQDDPDSAFNGVELSDYAFLRTKIDNAVEHGAAMLILCTDAFAMRSPTDEGAPPPDGLLRVELSESSLRRAIPVVHCRRAVVEGLILSTLGETLSEIEARIDHKLKPQSRDLPGSRVAGRVALAKRRRILRNVVASLDASGPLAQETLVIGAHYDHLGRGGWGSLAIGANAEIHNGADDNASGTAVLLEVARQLAARDEALPRRVLFIAFSAEELGLIGSSKYVQDPIVPLTDTIAMLNLDMVGRLRDSKLTIFGTGTAAEWPTLIDHANDPLGLTIRRSPGGYGPSDHASFYEHGVPVLHFFTGFHNQYHRPSDDSELLNIAGMRRIAGLVSEIAVEVASAETRPTSIRSSGEFDLAGIGDVADDVVARAREDRLVLGLIVAPAEEGVAGVRVQQLIPNAATVAHGIRPGDLLLSVDDRPTDSADAVSQALSEHPDGKTLRVRLKRRSVELELEIQI